MMYLLLAVALSLVHVLPHASAAYIVVYTVPTSGIYDYLFSFLYSLLFIFSFFLSHTDLGQGHVNPVLPLALELQRRGHQVFFTFFDDELHLV